MRSEVTESNDASAQFSQDIGEFVRPGKQGQELAPLNDRQRVDHGGQHYWVAVWKRSSEATPVTAVS